MTETKTGSPQHVSQLLSDLPVRSDGGQIIDTLVSLGLLDSEMLSDLVAHRVSETRIALYTSNQAVASRLRFQLSHIRDELKKRLVPRLQQVRIIVIDSAAVKPAQPHLNRPTASKQAVDQVLSASHCVNDPHLSRALARLARHLRQDQKAGTG